MRVTSATFIGARHICGGKGIRQARAQKFEVYLRIMPTITLNIVQRGLSSLPSHGESPKGYEKWDDESILFLCESGAWMMDFRRPVFGGQDTRLWQRSKCKMMGQWE